jgi:hypothetical protein
VALESAHHGAERVAKAVSPFGGLVVAPFKPLKTLVEAAR